MVRLHVNGEDAELTTVDPETPLVYALRNDLGLRGVRPGCAIGECGACVVLADGRPIRSCQTPLSAVAEARITTPEGLGTSEHPHPVQQAFLGEQAAQCGYCINGMIMTTASLVGSDAAAAPGEDDIQRALAEHICRCGTQHRVLRAIRRLCGKDEPPCTTVVQAPPLGEQQAEATSANDSIPRAIESFPNVEQWLRPTHDGRIEVLSGRVELGQGIRTALAQVVATELGLPVEQVVVRSAATDETPDEGYTAGSMSMELGGAALARAAAAYRRLLEAGETYPSGPILPSDRPSWAGPPAAVPRSDLADKLTGSGAYLHDLSLPGMLHARTLLPPTYDARPASLDLEAGRALPGVVDIVHEDGLVLVLAEREEQAVRAVASLRRSATWNDPGLPPTVTRTGLRDLESVPQPVASEGDVDTALAQGRQLSAAYSKPYEAHASMAPSAAVAQYGPDGITVWTHNQGVFPLRRELAALLGEPEKKLIVRHIDGPGCYGHNGADDAAGFAVLAARAAGGRPVRFQFSLQDEFGWEPYGAPMLADMSAALSSDGRITGWRHVVRTGPHGSRPNGSGDRLIVSWLRGAVERTWPAGGGEGGVRSANPIYDLPAREVRGEYVRGALRTSSLRSLGAYLNQFAIESFMDELAEAAGADPVEFRRAHLRDERALAVLDAVVRAANWRPRVGPGGAGGASGVGQGVAVARYKGAKAYVAQVAEVEVDTETGVIAVRRVVTACDAGGVVNPDGLANQLEGGTLQGLSRALHEEVRASASGIETVDWTSYPVLRFAEVPRLETIVLDRPGFPPLGAGEVTTPAIPAALANAVDDAIGVRFRDLPLTPERLRARLEALTEDELSRVRL
ncbi:molybdopterin-dependent oxidoreductase [Flindersiella endophytica]